MPHGKKCAFCGGSSSSFGGRLGSLLGPYNASRHGYEPVYVHQSCGVWSPQISQDVTLQLRSVGSEVRRARSLRCSCCGRPGAALGCRVPSCPSSFHLPCAIERGCTFNPELYLVACPTHAALFGHEPTAPAAQEQGSGPLAHLKLAGKRSRRPQPLPGSSRRRNQLSADQLGQHIDRAKAAFAMLSQQLATAETSEDDDAVIAAKDAKRLRKAAQQLAPTILRAPPAAAGAGPGGWRLQPSEQQQQQGLPVRRAELVLPQGGFSSLGGLAGVKQQLKEMVLLPLAQPHLASCLGIQMPRGILLHGPPGTGKTAIVRALAAECAALAQQPAASGSAPRPAVALFARKGTDCLGKYAGDAEQHLRLLFDMAAAAAPSVIFLDELDGLVPPRQLRSGGSDQIFSSIVSVLLALLDGLADRGQVLVIGATNRPDSIDPALRRPGRFDREVCVGLPSPAERRDILACLTARWSSPPSARLLQELAAATDGWAGADLQALASGALFAALRRSPELLAGAAADVCNEADAASPGATAATPRMVAAAADEQEQQQQEQRQEQQQQQDQQQEQQQQAPAAGCGASGGLFQAALANYLQQQQQQEQHVPLQPGVIGGSAPATPQPAAAPAATAAEPAADGSAAAGESPLRPLQQEQQQQKQQQQEQQQQEQQQQEQQQQEQQQLRAAAAAGSSVLPHIVVLPCDWQAALADSGPPCSRREAAGLAAINPAAPLPSVLAPLLLPALARLVPVLQASVDLGAGVVAAAAAAAAAGGGPQQHAAWEAELVQLGVVEAQQPASHTITDDTSGSDPAPASGLHGGCCPPPAALLLSGHGEVGQAALAAAVLQLLGCCGAGAAVHSLSLPGLLLAGGGSVLPGLVAGMRAAASRVSPGRLLVIHLPRIELWAAQPGSKPSSSRQQPAAPQAGAVGGTEFGAGSIAQQGAFASDSSDACSSSSSSSSEESDDGGSSSSAGGGEERDPNNDPGPAAASAQAAEDGGRKQQQQQQQRRRQQRRRPSRAGKQEQQSWRVSSAWPVFLQQLALLADKRVLLLAISHLAAEQMPAEMQQLFGWRGQGQHAWGHSNTGSATVQVCCVRSSSSGGSSSNTGQHAKHQALAAAVDRVLLAAAEQHKQAAARHNSCASDTVQQPSSSAGADAQQQLLRQQPQPPPPPQQPPPQQPQQEPQAQQHSGTHFQQLNDASKARAERLYAQVQLQLQRLGQTLLREPGVRMAAIKPAGGSSGASSRTQRMWWQAADREQLLQQRLPLAAVAFRAASGRYSSLDQFQADVAAAAGLIRQHHRRPTSAAAAAAAALQDLVAQCCQVISRQLQLDDPANAAALQAAAADAAAAAAAAACQAPAAAGDMLVAAAPSAPAASACDVDAARRAAAVGWASSGSRGAARQRWVQPPEPPELAACREAKLRQLAEDMQQQLLNGSDNCWRDLHTALRTLCRQAGCAVLL